MSAGGLGKRQLFPDNRPQSAILQTSTEPSVNFFFFGYGDAPKRKGVNRTTARHQVAGRDADVASAANDDYAAVPGKQLQVLAEVHIGEHFEDEVDTNPTGRLQNLVQVARLSVVKDVVRAFTLDQFESLLRAGGGKDHQAQRARHLSSGDAHTAAGARDQYCFASTSSPTLIT